MIEMDSINGRISDLFILFKVGDYDEPLSEIMSRVKREMDLESCRNPRPWYPFAYQYTPADDTLRKNIECWRKECGGQLPPRIDVLFCPVDTDSAEWEKSCKHRVPTSPDINMTVKLDSWRYMNRAVDHSFEVPHHYWVGGVKQRYYALVIEELELYPFNRIETLDLAYCRTYPKGVRIGRASTVNLWRKDLNPQDATIEDLWIIGRAVLRNPFAVELHKTP
ncbi:MAG: hypothetical protein ACTSWQ_11040 [Candidatus Thorarchaeota archaeon]